VDDSSEEEDEEDGEQPDLPLEATRGSLRVAKRLEVLHNTQLDKAQRLSRFFGVPDKVALGLEEGTRTPEMSRMLKTSQVESGKQPTLNKDSARPSEIDLTAPKMSIEDSIRAQWLISSLFFFFFFIVHRILQLTSVQVQAS
jgi:hypothetical protein